MNLAHVHLLLNHWPIIGSFIAVGLLVAAMMGKVDQLKRGSFALFAVIGLITVPAFMTGFSAEPIIQDPFFPDETMTRHVQEHLGAALLGFIALEITAALAWLALWEFRRTAQITSWLTNAVLVTGLLTLGLMALTGTTGGHIRHPEIVPEQDVAPAIATMGSAFAEGIKTFLTAENWRWATSETLHFAAMGLLFGVVLLADLRMLGVINGVSFASVHKLLPWGVAAFAVNLFTGVLFFVSAPGLYTKNIAFQWKMALLVLAGFNYVYLTVADEPWNLKPGDNPSLLSRAVGATTLVLIVGVMYYGRMLPWLGVEF
jgi:hypothetical protein